MKEDFEQLKALIKCIKYEENLRRKESKKKNDHHIGTENHVDLGEQSFCDGIAKFGASMMCGTQDDHLHDEKISEEEECLGFALHCIVNNVLIKHGIAPVWPKK